MKSSTRKNKPRTKASSADLFGTARNDATQGATPGPKADAPRKPGSTRAAGTAKKARPAARTGPKKGAPSRCPVALRRMSGLDAAAKVLADAGKPMRCVDMLDKILARGLWKTKGKTPAATLNAAIIREIKGTGRESRFKKTGRGMFAVGAKATTR